MKNYKEIVSKYFDKVKSKKMNFNFKNHKDTLKKHGNIFMSVLGVFIAAVISINIISAKETKRYKITNNRAEVYFYAVDYNNAIKEYEKIADKDKLSPMWDMKISEIYSVEGNVADSRKYITRAKQMDSKDEDILNYIVFTEFMNKDYNIAMKDGIAALKLYPKSKELIKTMFTVYMANQMLDNAKKLIKDYPYDSKSAYEMAEYSRMLMIVGNMDAGFKILKDAWLIDRDEYKIYDVLSQIAVYNRDSLLESITDLSQRYPQDVAYKMWLAKVYSGDADTAQQASQIIDQIKNKDIGKVEIKLITASVLQNSGQNSKADDLIDEVIRENSTDYRVLHTAGWYYLNKKDYGKAEKYCEESIVKNKDYPDNYGFLMPEILKAEGKSVEAEPYFRTALRLEPYNYNIMLNIANYYWTTTKNTNKALEYFKFAEIVKPSDPEIKYNMAMIHINNKETTQAVDLLKQCIKLNDAVPKYHRTLSTVYFAMNNSKDAYAQIKYAYNCDQQDILTLNNAGAYYITIDGNLERGLYNFTKAKEGINASTDKYTKDTITANYNKAKKLLDEYNNGSANASIAIPEFTLFY